MAAVDMQTANGQKPYAFLPPKITSQIEPTFFR